MSFLARFSPLRAIRDLRFFLSQRQPHEMYFLLAALMVTGIILVGFVKDSYFERTYKRDIVYVQQWKLDRTDAEIIAQQKIDQPIKDREMAAQKKREDDVRAQFKAMDDRLTKMGI